MLFDEGFIFSMLVVEGARARARACSFFWCACRTPCGLGSFARGTAFRALQFERLLPRIRVRFEVCRQVSLRRREGYLWPAEIYAVGSFGAIWFAREEKGVITVVIRKCAWGSAWAAADREHEHG